MGRAGASIFVWSVGGVVALSGCAVLEKPPKVTVEEIRPAPTQAGGSVEEVAVVLSLKNENDIPLELEDVRYSVAAGGAEGFHGHRAALLTIPANETTQLTLPAVLPAGSAGSATAWGSLRYLAPGHLAEILFETGVRRPSVSFSSKR